MIDRISPQASYDTHAPARHNAALCELLPEEDSDDDDEDEDEDDDDDDDEDEDEVQDPIVFKPSRRS